MNLLPPWAKEPRQFRILIIRTVAIQVAFLLLVGLVVFVLSTLENRMLARSNQLSVLLQDFDVLVEQAAQDADLARAYVFQLDDFFYMHRIHPFNPAWLTVLLETVPVGVDLVSAHYASETIVITAETTNIAIAEIHRRAIAQTDVFYDVRVGRVVGLGDYGYVYDLRIRVLFERYGYDF